MADTRPPITGGCLCGSVRYEADGPPVCVGYCHCSTCRRHTGAPLVAFVAFEGHKVRFTEQDRDIYESSPGIKRGFCSKCGTSLTWEGPYQGLSIIEFHVSTTDEPEAYEPELHWHHGEKLSWLKLVDDLPR